MALRGNLKDFSLPDVFQLVTFSKKTGVLRIARRDGATGSVWFRDGDVFFAQSNWHHAPIGERLVAAQKITPSALSKALEIRAREIDGGRRLGQILVDEGYITDKILEAFVQEQIQDTIFDLMRWDEGDFDFELLPEVVDEDIGLSVSIENVIMEGSRRLEEWARIKKKIPSMEVVFKMATAPGEGTFEISLKPIEWNLLLLIDGTRSVAALARETTRTDFEVARIVYGLFSAGLLEFATDEEVARLREERAEREAEAERVRAAAAEMREAATPPARVPVAEKMPAPETVVEPEPGPAPAPPESVQATPQAPAAPLEQPAREEDAPGDTSAERVPEVPEFLAGGGAGGSPTADDMAVFEQMMGVLEQPVVEEPAIVPELEPEPEITVEPEPEIEPEPEPEIEPEPEPEIEPEPDFERDLLALGLGETPRMDLLEPEQDVVQEQPEELEIPAEPGLGPELLEADEYAGELLAELQPEPSVEPLREPEAEPEPEPEPEAEQKPESGAAVGVRSPLGVLEHIEEELASEKGLLSAPEEPPVAAEDEESSGPDFGDILDSLDRISAESAPGIIQSETFADSAEPTEGVISTDSFLAEFDDGDFDISMRSGLGDELNALTGMERARPRASVNRIPEAGKQVGLHRDETVDKELLLKIIEGVKNL